MLKLNAFVFQDKDLFNKLNIDQHKEWILHLMGESPTTEMNLRFVVEMLTFFTNIFILPRFHVDIDYLKPEYKSERRECLSEVYTIKTDVIQNLLLWYIEPPSFFRDELGFLIYASEELYKLLDPDYEYQNHQTGSVVKWIEDFITNLIEVILVSPITIANKEDLIDDTTYIHFKILPGIEEDSECLWVFLSHEEITKDEFPF